MSNTDGALRRVQKTKLTGRNAHSQRNAPQGYKNRPQQFHNNQRNDTQSCGRCGKAPAHSRGDCPAKDAECRKCSKKGHCAAVCRSNKFVRHMEEEEDIILGAITEGQVNTLKEDWFHAKIQVNGQNIQFRVDTGADVSVIPDRFFKKNSSVIQTTSKKLFGPGKTDIKVMGMFTATLETERAKTRQDLYVIKDLQEPLLGRPAIEALGLLQLVSVLRVPALTDVKREFPGLFAGLGKLKKTYKISMKEDAVPFAVTAPRRIPLPMQEKVKAELKRLEEQDVIRPVTTPTDWCAPIVVVPKANEKVRICVDLTRLNDSVRRENFPLPTTDKLLAQLSGSTIFSKLDCNSGFHQLPLAEESQELTTFITPFGRYCYKRLPFGINSSPEVFHREVTHTLAGIPGVIVDIDDILISGKNQQEQDERLTTVLNKLQQAGATLN